MIDAATSGEATAVPADLPAFLDLENCYQCGKCTAGCPVAERMDVVPNQLVRLAQLGLVERARRAESIWQCVSCQTCSTRCPKSVDCAAVIDALRQLSFEKGDAAGSQRRTVLFQEAFLRNIRRNGRLNELELVGVFKTKAFLDDLSIPFLFKDAMLAPRMRAKGKLHFKPDRVKDGGVLERMFDRCLRQA
ncbi:MAG: 4Fe-4S dicluster domain-containing protein [Bryobacteraceae bacterium]|nr:4Fe-4S dicluster domain-containing protein [Bryobacteraceae bacterium]